MPLLTKAQNSLLYDITGRPYRETSYTNIEGSPFLTDIWINGTVKLLNGKVYKDVLLKYDLVADEPIFQSKNQQPLRFVEQVAEFNLVFPETDSLQGRLFRNGFKNTDTYTSKTFYEVLEEGNMTLLKRIKQEINEVRPFNSASVTRNFLEAEAYYIFHNAEIVRFKKDKAGLLTLTGDQEPMVEKFISQNKLNVKNEADLIRIVKYYNTL